MRGYYIYNEDPSFGVERKINMQMEELSRFIPCTRLKLTLSHKLSLSEKLRMVSPTAPTYDFSGVIDQIQNPDYVYFRKISVDSGIVGLLREIKKRYPKCTVFMEFPVYPYSCEAYYSSVKKFIRQFPFWIKDLLYRGKLKKYVDYIPTFYPADRIYGIKALQIKNGIRVDAIAPVHNLSIDDTIDLFSVAAMAIHHGYERLIQGLYNYYQAGGTRKIVYHCVGYGPEEAKYKSLAEQLGIAEHVIFYGKMVGTELDQMYERMDIAVASLAIYKLNLKVGSFIKTGEYLSKGIPMITGSPVDVLDHSDFDYFLEFPNDDSPIDMNKVIDFYDRIYSVGDKTETVGNIRDYAYKKVDMSVALKNVTDILKNIMGGK